MKKLLPLLMLLACADEEVRRFEPWVGVYRVDDYRLDEATCGPDGPEADAPASHLLLEAAVFPDDAFVRALRCSGPEQCNSGAHFELVVDEVSDRRLTGTAVDFTFFPISSEEGACNVQVARVEMVRDGDAVDLMVRRQEARDVRVASQEDCAGLADELTDDDCRFFEDFELTQVR